METIKEYLQQIRVFQWRLKRPPQNDYGGVFIIRATTKPEVGENVTSGVTAPYCVSDRQCLLDLNRTKELLAAAFEELLVGHSFVNLNSLVDNLAADLLCQFRFSPEFLNREETRPVILFDLIIAVEREESDHDCTLDSSGIVSEDEPLVREFHDDEEMKEIEDEIEEYLKQSPERIDDQKPNTAALHEIKPAIKLRKFSEIDNETHVKRTSSNSTDDHGDHDSQVKLCSICLEKLSQGEVVAETTACSHMFHRTCVLNWLIRGDSCPVCRSCFRIPACPPCFRISV